MINALKDNDKCFSHAATLALNYREFGKSCRRMSKNKNFSDKNNSSHKICENKSWLCALLRGLTSKNQR